MKTPLRYVYDPAFFDRLCPLLNDCMSGFDSRDFIFRIFNNAWPDMELMERATHISTVLHHFLPTDFPAAVKKIIAISRGLEKKDLPHHGLECIFLANYIRTYGRDFPELSAMALQEVRKAIGAEFSMERPFMHEPRAAHEA